MKLKTRRLLIVDDSADVREALSLWLSRNGFEVSLAASVAEARELLMDRNIDLILLDILMPNEDGISFLRSLDDGPSPR